MGGRWKPGPHCGAGGRRLGMRSPPRIEPAAAGEAQVRLGHAGAEDELGHRTREEVEVAQIEAGAARRAAVAAARGPPSPRPPFRARALLVSRGEALQRTCARILIVHLREIEIECIPYPLLPRCPTAVGVARPLLVEKRGELGLLVRQLLEEGLHLLERAAARLGHPSQHEEPREECDGREEEEGACEEAHALVPRS
eukprot:scaffold1534_cov54-Phaeocystis_antarctica.AAC.4